ncbi:MAG: fatty acid desaturase [Oceanicoccus sp.]
MVFSFNQTTQEVLEQVVREPRFQTLTKLPVFAPMEIGLGLFAFILFGTGTALYLSGYIPLLLMLVINSFAIYASFTPLHDATHRSVSSNRQINDLIGTLCCLLLLPGITTRIYRYLHLEHHRFAGSPTKDPDELFVAAPAWALPFVLASLDVHWSLWYIKHWNSRPKSERIEFVACMSFYVGVHIFFLTSPYALAFFLCFMIPQRFGLFYVAWFFAHIQHPKGVEWEDAPFQTTVRVKTNEVGSWLLLGQAFHCLHHLAPSIPYYRYKKAWTLGEHLFERQNVPTRTLWRESTDLVLPSKQTETWLSAKVASITLVADDIAAYEFVPNNQEVWPRFEAGAHIDVNLRQGLVRQYSLYNSPADNQRYRVAVRQDVNGAGGSVFMHTEVKQDDVLNISAPRNNFPLQHDFEHYLLVAGGIGITPLLAMAHELYSRNTSFELHVFAKHLNDVAFHDRLTDFPFAARITVHTNDGAGFARSKISTNVKRYQPGNVMYLCGPTNFMESVIDSAKQVAWPTEHIYLETFVPPEIDETQNELFEVELASTGEVLTVKADEHLIDVLHDNGYAVMCSCTQGMCGSCITPVLEGVPEHRDSILSDEKRAANKSMTVCVSRSKSKRLVLDL